MFKQKHKPSSLRRRTSDEGDDVGVDIKRLKLEQKIRNEVKNGISTEDLMKASKTAVSDSLNGKEMSALDYVINKKESDESEKKRSDSIVEDPELEKMIRDESEIYKLKGKAIPSILEDDIKRMEDDPKEVEIKDGHRETIEEINQLKIKLIKELKYQRRKMNENV